MADHLKGWRLFLGRPHGWVSWVALVGVCLAGQFFTARRGHYDWVENVAVGAVIMAGLVTAVRVPRELRLAALLVSKGVVVGLLFDASVRATGPAHDEVGAGWLAGAVLGASVVVFAGSVLEQRDSGGRVGAGCRAVPVISPVSTPTASAGGDSPRSRWGLVGVAAFAGALLGSVVSRRRQR